MKWTPDKLIEELQELIENSSDNEVVGLAGALLCALMPDCPEWNTEGADV